VVNQTGTICRKKITRVGIFFLGVFFSNSKEIRDALSTLRRRGLAYRGVLRFNMPWFLGQQRQGYSYRAWVKKDRKRLKIELSEMKTIAVAYLARGAHPDWLSALERFLDSYRRNQPGCEHTLYVIFKGFANNRDLERARDIFSGVPYKPVFLADESFDLGAYIEWANMIEEELICVLNTASEILAPNWIRKLAVNLLLPNVGLVGATGSYESLSVLNKAFPGFPNIHIRTNAFMIERELFCSITNGVKIADKMDAWLFESGPRSLTRRVLDKGMEAFLVGSNGFAYSPQFWAVSNIYRQGKQENLLVADNQTRSFSLSPPSERRVAASSAWGDYTNGKTPK